MKASETFAPPCRFGRQKKVSRKLLRDSAAALQSMRVVKIRDEMRRRSGWDPTHDD